MEDFERVQIEALIINNKEVSEEDLDATLRTYGRAKTVLKAQPDSHETQILWGTDDDRMILVKKKEVVYESESGKCKLVLTDFHDNKPNWGIAINVYSQDGSAYSRLGETLLAIKEDGGLESPLGLIKPELAGAIIELFETVPKVEFVSAA